VAKTSGKKKSGTPVKSPAKKQAGKKVIIKRDRRAATGVEGFGMEIPPKKPKKKLGDKRKNNGAG